MPGASRYVRGGVIAYADAVKVDLLDVDPEVLARLGAVSPEVAEAMARGVARRLGADLGLAITGVAGPGAEGTTEAGRAHPRGRVPGADGSRSRELRESGDREGNRAAAVRAALALGMRLVDGHADAGSQRSDTPARRPPGSLG